MLNQNDKSRNEKLLLVKLSESYPLPVQRRFGADSSSVPRRPLYKCNKQNTFKPVVIRAGGNSLFSLSGSFYGKKYMRLWVHHGNVVIYLILPEPIVYKSLAWSRGVVVVHGLHALLQKRQDDLIRLGHPHSARSGSATRHAKLSQFRAGMFKVFAES